MAKNREPVEPQSESGEEDEEEVSSEEIDSQDSDSEAELTQVSKKAASSLPATTHKKVQPESAVKAQTASSSDEEESGSESESESESDKADTQKSIGARKPRSNLNAPEPVTPVKSTTQRNDKEGEGKDTEKANKKLEPETSEKKLVDDSKKLFQRLWSEDDEIVILQGIMEYAIRKRADPMSDLNAFHDFIKKSLHVDVTRTQLQDKIRRLKKKYENNKSKEKEGKDRTFSKPHEQKAYELSKSIWGEATKELVSGLRVGSPKANGSAVRKASNKRAANVADDEEAKGSKCVVVMSNEGENKPLGKRVNSSGLTVEEMILAAGSEIFEAGKSVEGEREWKKLRLEEFELHLRQLEVKTAQTRLVLDALKSAEH